MKRVIALGATLALLLAPVLVCLLLAQSPAPPPPPSYMLTDLGPMTVSAIDQQNARSGPTALNGTSQVAGFRANLAFNDQFIGFLWDKGNFTDLGTGGGPTSFAHGINRTGQIVGTSNFVASSTFSGDLTGNSSRAFIYQNGVMTILDADPNFWSRAYAINAGGDAAGFIATSGPFPVIWKGGTAAGRTMLQSLPCSLASCQGEALAINDLGQAAGWSVGGNVNVARPVMWDSNGQPTDLIPNPGYYTEATGINNGGVVVGYYQPGQVSNTPIHAFSWQSGVLTDLGAVGNDTYSGAWGINSKGDIVGISGTNANPILVGSGGGGRAFVYTGGIMHDLTSLLVSGTNWSLDAAFAINDNGQIVGTGVAPDRTEHGYLLTPVLTQTTTTLFSSASPSVSGQQLSFTATVTPNTSSSNPPTGTVTFSDGATVLGTVALSSGTAIFKTAGLAVGTHAITASYGGDNNFGSSTSSVVNQAVDGASTSTALAVSPNPANSGQTVTFTATVTPVAPGAGTPTGTVKFLDGGTALGTGAVNSAGNATFTSSSPAVGSHSITAVYGGDTRFVGSVSSSVNQVVSQPATSTALTASPNPANLGQTVTFTATVTVVAPGVGTPTGTVTFLDGPTTLGVGVLSPAGTVMFSTSSLAVGSHTVTASYGGDATFAGSTSTGVIVTVQGPVQIMVNETVHVADNASFPDAFDAENVKVTDQVTVHAFFPIAIGPAPPILSAVLNQPYSGVTFSGTGGYQALTLSESGAVPGMSFTISGASATFSGTPTQTGTFPFTITETDSIGNVLNQSYSLVVAAACPSISVSPSGSLGTVTAGSLYSTKFAASGGIGTLTWSESGPLPTGLLFSSVSGIFGNQGSLSGVPSQAGLFPITVTAIDQNACRGSSNVSLLVVPPPAVITVNETIHVTDTPSFPDVFDPEQIHVTDQVSVIPCDFTLTANSPANVPVGGSGSTPITITSVNGCNLQVSLAASSPFLGATVSLPSTATTGGSSTSATLTVSAGPSVTPTSFTVTITGTSGLTHSSSVSVNITASISGTIGVVQTLTNAGAINNVGIANALTSKLSAAQSAGSPQTSINTLKAFQNQVQAQAGQHIATSFTLAGVTFNPASTLMANGQALIDSFRVSMIPDPITGYVVNSSGMAVPGATVSIADATGTVVASATTDVTGFYFMATTGILIPGTNYNIRVSTLPSGFTNASPSNQSFTWQGVAVALNNFVLN